MKTVLRKMGIPIAVIVMLIIVAMVFVLPMQLQVAFAATINDSAKIVNKTEDISDFIKDWQTVSNETLLTDFANNEFKLYELSPTGSTGR